MTQLSALSSEQAERSVSLQELIAVYTVSVFQYTLTFRQVIQIIWHWPVQTRFWYKQFLGWPLSILVSPLIYISWEVASCFYLRIVIPAYKSERVVYMLNDIFFISLLLLRYLQYYTFLNVKYSFQTPSWILCPSDLSSPILDFPIHYNIILHIYDGCAVPQIYIDQEEGLSFSC